MARYSIPVVLGGASGAAQLGTDGKVGGPGGSALTSSVPQVDVATALVDGNLLYFDSASGKFKGKTAASLAPGAAFLLPSGDTSGVTDDTNYNALVSAIVASGLGTEIVLVNKISGGVQVPFYTANSALTWTSKGWMVPCGNGDGGPLGLRGVGWPKLCPVGSAKTGIWCHRNGPYGGTGDWPPPAYVRDIVVDGSLATGKSFGWDVGDGEGLHVRGVAQNFVDGSVGDAHGFHLSNRYFFTEKSTFELIVYNCDNGVWMTFNGATGGDSSWEYNLLRFRCIMNGQSSNNQNGVVVQNVALGGCELHIMGNMAHTLAASGTPSVNGGTGLPCAGLTFLSGSIGSSTRLWNGDLHMKMEMNSGTGVKPYTIVSDGVGNLQRVAGRISTGLGGIVMGGAECTFGGPLSANDYTGSLADIVPAIPSSGGWTGNGPTALPASGFTWTNLGPDLEVRLSGGTGVTVTINGVAMGGSGQIFYLAAGATFNLVYSTAPTMTVRLVRRSA